MIKLDNIQSTMTAGTIMTDGACFDRVVWVDGVRQAGALRWRESLPVMGDMTRGMSSEGTDRTVAVNQSVWKPEAEDGSPTK